MDFSNPAAVSVTRLAIFDFDGTILSGNSWHEFFRSEIRRCPSRAPLLISGYVLRRLRWWSGERLRDFALRGLRGLTTAKVSALGEHLHAVRLAPQVRAAAFAEIGRRRAAGFLIVIATGTFDFVVAPFARAVRADMVIATSVAFKDGHCLGRVIGAETLGPAKAAALKVKAEAHGPIDWDASCAYSDSMIDRPLLAMVGERRFVSRKSLLPADAPAGTTLVSWGDESASSPMPR